MIEGKTKTITPLWEGSDVATAGAKNDITAGDGAKHDIMVGKAELATLTTCNVFEHLRSKGVPVAYIGRDGPTTFLTKICDMIHVEVVVRRIAMGSYCKRHPSVVAGAVFENPVVEFFYKTTGRKIGDQELPCDDPLIRYDADIKAWYWYHPAEENSLGTLLKMSADAAYSLSQQLAECAVIATDVNTHLSDAWRMLRGTLYDFKLEFGVLPDCSIVLADVVDCDSWRVEWNGIQLSKQGYRDGDDLDRVLGVYRLAASLTGQLVWARSS
jgi:phosphoribosylaminoimidazole-succinocarboxamide synthase